MEENVNTVTLTCDMVSGCIEPVTHIDNKGYVYCTNHGVQRRGARPCRKLTASELRKLQSGGTIARY